MTIRSSESQHREKGHRGYGRTRVLDGIAERGDDTEFESLLGIVPLDIHQCPASQGHLVDLQVGQTGIEVTTPIDESVRAVEQALFV